MSHRALTAAQRKALQQKILTRCTEDGGCLIWPGAMADGTSPQVRVGGRTFTARRFLYEQTIGPVPAGKYIGVQCECQRCLRHIGPMSPGEVSRKVAATGALSAAVNGPKIAAGRRHHKKYDDAFVDQLRASDLPTMELSRETGVSFSHLYKVRSGAARRHDRPNPFAGLGAMTGSVA